MIKRNNYVTFKNKGETFIGVVKTGGLTPIVIFLRDGIKYQLKASAACFTVVSSSKAPKGLTLPDPIKKGSWVTFKEDGITKTGVVINGGLSPTVTFMENGKPARVKGDAELFTIMSEHDVEEYKSKPERGYYENAV